MVATLAMIEQPKSAAIIRTPPEDQDSDAPLLKGDEKEVTEKELLIVQSRPITAKFRTSIRHLRLRAGRLSRFRGFHIYLANIFIRSIVVKSLSRFFGRSLVAVALLEVLVSVGLCRVTLLWNHVVISEPSKKSWLHRMVSRKQAFKIVLPTAIYSLLEHGTLSISRAIAKHSSSMISQLIANPERVNHYSLMAEAVRMMVMGVLVPIFIRIPAIIMITRVRASLLDQEEEPIVPFDRTFGGRVISSAAGGKGRLGIWEAWKTFDWNSLIRVHKIYIKLTVVYLASNFLWAIVIFAESRMISDVGFEKSLMAAIRKRNH
jgi:hypothetical protein